MGKFDGILICTDLDGTLFKNDKTISEENIEAIEYFKQNGGIFTFITGRIAFLAKDVYEMVKPNAPAGSINGGAIFDYEKNEYIFKTAISDAWRTLVKEVEQIVPEAGIQTVCYENIYFYKENDAVRAYREMTNLPNLTCHYNDIKEEVAKVIMVDSSEENLDKIKRHLENHILSDEFDFCRSEETLYEILPKGVNKGNGLKKLASVTGAVKTVAIGDYDNDVSMLEAADIGVAVSNACDKAKKAADYITVSNEESAIAKVIYDIENGILKF